MPDDYRESVCGKESRVRGPRRRNLAARPRPRLYPPRRLIAQSVEATQTTYLELAIVDSLAQWIDAGEVARMRLTPLWLDEDPPQGLLRALVADRLRD